MSFGRFTAAALALGAALGTTSASFASIVYQINQSSSTPEVGGELSPLSDTVHGTITTDGVIGPVLTSDILGWDLHIDDNYRPAYDVELTPANSGIWYDTGNGLVASATSLSFNFSNPGAVFIIQGLTHGFSSGYQYFCFQATTGPCIQGETIVPYYFAVDGVSATGFSGVVPLSGVPEPATWSVMLLGLASAGGALRGRRRAAGPA